MLLTIGISSLESFISLLGIIVVFILVLGLSYITTKWLGSSGMLQQRSSNISIVETYKLGPNKFIQIVRIGERYFSLGIGKDTVAYLSELSEEELNLEQYKSMNNRTSESFKNILEKFNKKISDNSENIQ